MWFERPGLGWADRRLRRPDQERLAKILTGHTRLRPEPRFRLPAFGTQR